MRKCPNCGNAPTEVSEITGLPKHMLLYWCGECGMLAHGHSRQSRLICLPGMKVANGATAVLPESMMAPSAIGEPLTAEQRKDIAVS